MIYDCIIIGGGIAGLQAAIQLGRYMHKVLVIDAGDGRSTWCNSYHNILGYPDGISGPELREKGYSQAKLYGVEFVLGRVEDVNQQSENFTALIHNGQTYTGKRLLLATGVADRLPDIPELYPCLGKSVYICPDCDGYEVRNQRCIVLGSGNVGANAALTLHYWTKQLIYVNHEQQAIDSRIQEKLQQNHIEYYEMPIEQVLSSKDGQFEGVVLSDGRKITANHGFAAFGKNEVKTDLAAKLGVERLENKHIVVDPRSKMTSVNNVWAAGDIVAHSEQVTVAMADGLQAAIWIHKSLLSQN